MHNTPVINILCDRDGTLIEDRHYLSSPEQIQFFPGVFAALKKVQERNIALFVVTNQSGIGRGYFSMADYVQCELALKQHLQEQGITLQDTAFCPHIPEEACNCRKPALGMWQALQKKYGLVAQATAMLGDKPEDILFGHRVGCAYSILVLTGKGQESAKKLGLPPLPSGTEYLYYPDRSPEQPHVLARDVPAALDFLLLCTKGNTNP